LTTESIRKEMTLLLLADTDWFIPEILLRVSVSILKKKKFGLQRTGGRDFQTHFEANLRAILHFTPGPQG
jgi:hypothetical protein